MQMPGRFLWFPFPLPGRRRQAAHDAALAGLRAELDRTRQAAAEQQRATMPAWPERPTSCARR